MPIKHRFLRDSYKNGVVEFKAGEEYDPTERTAIQVAQGAAVAIEVKPPRLTAAERKAAEEAAAAEAAAKADAERKAAEAAAAEAAANPGMFPAADDTQ